MRIDATELKESLSIDDISKLLTELGAESTHHNTNKGELITNTICHNHSNGSHKLFYYEDSYSFHCYTSCGCNYDIFSLIEKRYKLLNKEISFTEAIRYVASKTGRETSNATFGDSFIIPNEPTINEELKWMQRVSKKKKVELSEPVTHSEKILEVFSNIHHPEFLKDNISSEAMKKFKIMYYNRGNRIVIPHFHPTNGKLIGIRGRALNEWEIETTKYLPLTIQNTMYNFSSYSQIYGLWQNKDTILKLRKAILFESEKSVLQCESYYCGNNFSIAMMGRNISDYQVRLLLSLGIEEIIIATDKMFRDGNELEREREIEYLLRIGRKFSPYIRTFVLFDEKGLLEYKTSPSDHGKEALEMMMKNKTEILNKE